MLILKIILSILTTIVTFGSIGLWTYWHHLNGTLYPIEDGEDLLHWNVRYFETEKIKDR